MTIQSRIEALEAELAELKKEVGKGEWPRPGDKYFFINNTGNTDSDTEDYACNLNGESLSDERRIFLGIFKDKESAQRKLDIVKAVFPSEVWVPSYGDKVWMAWPLRSSAMELWEASHSQLIMLARGAVHRTQESAETYREKLIAYGKYLADMRRPSCE